MGDRGLGIEERRVTIKAPFAMSIYEVTFAEWEACVDDGGCGYRPHDEHFGRGRRPVLNVSWNDIQSYLKWLSQKTSQHYRLPSELEWEYAARAGSTAAYSWGREIGNNRANCNGCGSQWDNKRTAPVGSFSANAWGLHDMHGNVWEWTQDCWQERCEERILRSGAWSDEPWMLRAAFRYRYAPEVQADFIGFRLARTLTNKEISEAADTKQK